MEGLDVHIGFFLILILYHSIYNYFYFLVIQYTTITDYFIYKDKLTKNPSRYIYTEQYSSNWKRAKGGKI